MIANQIVSGWDEAFIVINVALAGAAFVFNVAAAMDKTRRSILGRAIHSSVAALALGYAGAYAYLILSDITVNRWSSVMRGVSLAAWVFAWIAPTFIREQPVAEETLLVEIERRLVEIDIR